jgi:hypothetical protein
MPTRFAKVTEDLFRGGVPSEDDLCMLKDIWGVKKIVSLDEESGLKIQPACKALGLKQVLWGLGSGDDPKVSVLKNSIVPTLTDDGPTYVHCYHGKDRTGMCIAMYRILSGWDVKKALEEAHSFGMGSHLDIDDAKSYYKAVENFSADSSNTDDAVSVSRKSMFGNPPITNDSTLPGFYNSFAPMESMEYAPLSRIASERVYTKSSAANILKQKEWYHGKKEALNSEKDGMIFSGIIHSSAKVDVIDGNFDRSLLFDSILKDMDVVKFSDKIIVLNPSMIIEIDELGDYSDAFDAGLVGSRDSSSDYTHVYPGSGGGITGMPVGEIPASVPDGAAGFTQLPFGGGYNF